MAFFLRLAVGLAMFMGSGAAAPRVVADGASLTLEVDRTADVEVVYRGGDRVSVRALQQEVTSLRTDLTAAQATQEANAGSFITAEAVSRLAERVASANATAVTAWQTAQSAAETAQAAEDAAVAGADPAAVAAVVAQAVARALGPLQTQMAVLVANATCQAALMAAVPANAWALTSICDSGEGGTCQIGCRPGFASTLAANIARGKPVRARGNALVRPGESESVYLPRAITDGAAPSGAIAQGSADDPQRWLAWCDSGSPGDADSSRPAQRGDRPCLVTIDLEEVSTIDEVEYTLSFGMLVCQHTVDVWTGSDTADLDTVHADADDANWNTIVTTATPMSGLAADDFPQVSARFVRLSFDVSNGAGGPCGRWPAFSTQYFGLLRLSEVAISGTAVAPISCRNGVWSHLPQNFACVPRI